MYHILGAQRHRQDGASLRKYQALAAPAAGPRTDSEGLVELPAAVLAGVGGMDQQRHLALTGSGLDALGAIDEHAAASLQAKPVERLAAQRGFDPLPEVGRDVDVAGLERPGERALELALGIGFVQRLAANADP